MDEFELYKFYFDLGLSNSDIWSCIPDEVIDWVTKALEFFKASITITQERIAEGDNND